MPAHRPPTLSYQVSSRLLATYAAAWALIALLLATGLAAFYLTDLSYSSALNRAVEIQAGAQNLNAAMVTEMLNTRAFLISGDESAATRRRLAHEEFTREKADLDRQLAALSAIHTPSYATLIRLHGEYDAVADRIITLVKNGDTDAARAVFDDQSDPLVMALQDASSRLESEIQTGLDESSRSYSSRSRIFIQVIGGVFLASTLLAGLALLRRVAPELRALDYFESAVINAGETQVYHPIEALPDQDGSPPRLFEAYNRLVQRMLDGNSAILKYVSHLNHDVNTLLASILGYGYMVADPALRPGDADLGEYGRVIVEQTRRTTALVEDFTLAAKIEGGTFSPSLMPVRLGPLLAALVEEVAIESGRDVTLAGETGGVIVLADALSLEKALRGLLDNAVKFSAPGSPVTLAVETGGAPRVVRLRVCDQGIGIAAHEMSWLFRPFSRINNESTRGMTGNGLGLYIASAIARVHYGSLTVESQPGAGSVFTFSLPLEEGT